MARLSVADVLVDGLARAGAERIFAAPAAPPAVRAAAVRRRLDLVEALDSATAGVLAAVSGVVGEAPGAMLAGLDDTPGLLRGLAHARRERAPVIVLTGVGGDAGLLAPAVKAAVAVEPPSAGHWIAHAAQLAMADPRGPVHLLLGAGVTEQPAPPVAAACRRAPLPPPGPAELDTLAAVLADATRPLLIAGLECGPDDTRWIRSFAEALPAPVLATTRGKGALADPHPLALGALVPGHAALARADLIVLLGVDDGELPPGLLPPGVRLARIGRAPWAGGEAVLDIRGDLALVIEELAPHVRARPAADWDVAELDRVKRAVTRTTTPAARVVALAREATPAGTLATGEVSALTAWQAVGPHETLRPIGEPPPGYAVLAALAAQLAHPDRRVVAFMHPGGLAAAEVGLAMASARGLPIVVVILGPVAGELARDLPSRGWLVAEVAAASFRAGFDRAFAARRPALVVATDL